MITSKIRPSIAWCAAVTGLVVTFSANAHGPASTPTNTDPGREIVFPDTAERLTLVVDLHTHSVFSDGHVWPRIRVAEAIRDGLDAMAVTEHLEWQPHLMDIPHPDRNRSYQEAVASLPDGSDLILIPGSEITRRAPYGHMNAVFITDANALVQVPAEVPEPFDPRAYALASFEFPAQAVIDEANAQGGFVFWNHSWSDFPNRMTEMTDFHRQAARDGKLHGIEVANGDTYSPEAFQIALNHDLTLIGVSDVHNLIDWDYEPHKGGHRPVNLVFATDRSAAAIRSALFDGRTVVWFRNLLIGREQDLLPLIRASLDVENAAWMGPGSVLEFDISNVSDAAFVLDNLTEHTLTQTAGSVLVPPHSRETVRMRISERVPTVELKFRVRNALTSPETHPVIDHMLTMETAPAE
jgi:hypothetical protein